MKNKVLFILRVLGIVILLTAALGSQFGTGNLARAQAASGESTQEGANAAQPAAFSLDELPASLGTPATDTAGTATPEQVEAGWTALMSETFEGDFPTGLWSVVDANGTTGGDVYWEQDDFKPYTGAWSAYAARGGVDGVEPNETEFYYPNDMDSVMAYGPFDLSNCAAAYFDFNYWNLSESPFDLFAWYASSDGLEYEGSSVTGDSGGWRYQAMDLESYLGDGSVWLAFRFTSDHTYSDQGAFVDDISLQCYPAASAVSWTFLVYMDGDNSLEDAAVYDFLEMSRIGSSASVNVVVQMDRIPGNYSGYDDWTDTRRFHVTTGMDPLAANGVSIGEADMGEAETLVDFVSWGMEFYPAAHYALVIWDHGNGLIARNADEMLTEGIAYDETDADYIDMPELRSALATLTGNGSTPIDLIGLDASMMASIEVDAQIRPYATVRVGSEESIPEDGWPYDTILTGLVANPTWTAAQLGTRIVDDYYAFYPEGYTHSAVNLGTTYATLLTAVDAFAQALIDQASSNREWTIQARNIALEFDDPRYVDLWDFADLVGIYTGNPQLISTGLAVKNAITATIIREKHGEEWQFARGISIFFPETEGGYDPRYDDSTGFLQFSGSTRWDEWLGVFFDLPSYPGTFVKIAPANLATNQLLSLTLQWGSSSKATSYEYCIDTVNDGACNTSWLTNGTSTSKTISDLIASTTYYWHVRAVNSFGYTYSNGSTTAYWSFTTGQLPAAFGKSTPVPGATSQAVNLNLTWGTSTYATSYEYCIDDTEAATCSTSWVNVGNTFSAGITGLQPGTTYYWHVRANNSFGTTYSNGSDSAFWSFTTGPAPAAFNKLTPTDNATGLATNPTLTWEASSGAVSYAYCYDQTDDDECTTWISTSGTSAALTGLPYDAVYYWHVRATNSYGTTYSNGSATAYWKFTIGHPPLAFGKVSPSIGATGQVLNLILTWEASTDATSYQYCVDTTIDTSCSTSWQTVTTNSATLSLNSGTNYSWHVRAVNNVGTTYSDGASTAFWSFTTGTAPGAFSKLTPINLSQNLLPNPTLTWGASSGATSYEYCLDTTAETTCSTSWVSVGLNTSVDLSDLELGKYYFWHVRAVNGIGTTYSNGSATIFWSFQTGFGPAAFNKTSPSDGATGQALSLTLIWGASSGVTSYEYCYDTSDDDACDTWTSTSLTSALLSGLELDTTYYWHVRAINTYGTTYSNGSDTAFWSFRTAVLLDAFGKSTPEDGAIDQPISMTLTWEAVTGAARYEICYDTIDNDACDGAWQSAGTSTSLAIPSGLRDNTTYYWQVRAVNAVETEYADAGAWWSFTTIDIPLVNIYLPLVVR